MKTYSPYLNQWDTSPDTYFDIVLSPMLAGDYDSDNDVDGADFLVWQRGFGSATDLAADGNQDGLVNAADLTIWQNNYGLSLNASTSPMTAVPEPATLLLLVLVPAAIGSRRGRITCVRWEGSEKCP